MIRIPEELSELDEKLITGFQEGDLVVIGGATSMGKTAFTLTLLHHFAASSLKLNVALFSTEMVKNTIYTRLLSINSQVRLDEIMGNRLDKEKKQLVEESRKKLNQASIYIQDKQNISITDIENESRELKKQGQLDIIFIDYLQMVKVQMPENMDYNREQEIFHIVKALKDLAKELQVPVILNSQLNRKASYGQPKLNDLRDSGTIEEIADIVILINRPEFYGVVQDFSGYPLKGIAEVTIAKNKNGELGEVRIKFISEYAMFRNLFQEKFDFNDTKPQEITKTYSSKINVVSNNPKSESKSHPPIDEPPF